MSLDAEPVYRRPSPGESHGMSLSRGIEQSFDCLGEPPRIRRRDQDSGGPMLDDLRNAPHRGGNHRQAYRHCFDDDGRESLGQRWEHKDVCRRQHAGDIGSVAGKMH